MDAAAQFLTLVQTGILVRLGEKLGNLSPSQRAAYAMEFMAEAVQKSRDVKDPLREAHEFLGSCFSDYEREIEKVKLPSAG
jgi:hypothetical protein